MIMIYQKLATEKPPFNYGEVRFSHFEIDAHTGR